VRYIPYLFTIRNGQNDTSSLIHIPRKGWLVPWLSRSKI
jgi:hypothetical protein